jgi:hypothetical protein
MESEHKGFMKLGRPWVIFFMLGICLLIMVLFNTRRLAISSLALQEAAGGLTILDTRLIYGQVDIDQLLIALEQAGRSAYQLTHLTLDLVFPIAYSLFFASASLWLTEKLGLASPQKMRIAMLLLLAGVFDLLENFSIMGMVAAYPSQVPALALLSQLFTLIKFGLFAINILFLVILIFMAIKHRKVS